MWASAPAIASLGVPSADAYPTVFCSVLSAWKFIPKITGTSAAWVLEHIFYDYDETPVSWGRFVCRGERLQFRAGVGVQTPGVPPERRKTRR